MFEVDKETMPKHVAIILDGNGRWAKRRNMPRVYGHKAGLQNLIKVAEFADKIGIECLTVFAFSTENWNRPKAEVRYIMSAPIFFTNKNLQKLNELNISIKFIGRKDRFSKKTLDAINTIEEKTKNNIGMVLNIAFDYGGQDEIVRAVKKISEKVLSNELEISDIDEKMFENHLFTKNNPPLDLLIRTSGEQRVSNFLLWQLAYAEMYFTECYWPDFGEEEFLKAIDNYKRRNRRFGSVEMGDNQ